MGQNQYLMEMSVGEVCLAELTQRWVNKAHQRLSSIGIVGFMSNFVLDNIYFHIMQDAVGAGKYFVLIFPIKGDVEIFGPFL
jgi:hypothetical protein